MDPYRNIDPAAYAGKVRVLVLDEFDYMRSLIASMLDQWHKPIAPIPAENTEQAMETLERFDPAVVFTNLNLEFIRQVRDPKSSPNPYVPIIMLTSRVELPVVLQARDAGVNEFLAKPVSVHALLTRLTTVLTKPRPFVREETYFGPDRRRRDLGPPTNVGVDRREHTAKLFDPILAKPRRKKVVNRLPGEHEPPR